MNDKKCFEALDQTFRDLFNRPTQVFGGKPHMLGEDFSKTLPIKKGAPRDGIIAASIAESDLWHHFKIFFLTENMRLQSPNMKDEARIQCRAFSQWLLDTGDGTAGIPDADDPHNTSWVRIPDQYCLPPDEQGVEQLIDFIYDRGALQTPTVA